MNLRGIFSDETENFVKYKDGFVEISIRTLEKDVQSVIFVHNSSFIEMEKAYCAEGFDYFSVLVEEKEVIKYYFILKDDENECVYSKNGFDGYIIPFKLYPYFNVPEWSVGCVGYQIFVDRFCNGDKSNDVLDREYLYLGRLSKSLEWTDRVKEVDVCNFYGGDLQGVMDKMDYLKSLGVEVIYFNPLFVSPSSHKYDIQDYDYIDPHFGVIEQDGGDILHFDKFENKYADKYRIRTTSKINLEKSNELFIKLVEKAHSSGIKIILDGVFNHCGAFNKWLDSERFYEKSGYQKGAFDEESEYRDFFIWNTGEYEGWWNHKNHPKLNYENSKKLYDYIMNIGVKWVSPPFNCDGWRLDVAKDLGQSVEFNYRFWEDFSKNVKNANPNAIIIAENYGDSSPWLDGKKWDSVMNYDAFMEPITYFLTGMEKHSEDRNEKLRNNSDYFIKSILNNMAKMPIQSRLIAMNQLSNHDHSRFLTRTNCKVGRLGICESIEAEQGVNKSIFNIAITFMMTWVGSPTLYYGDEAGLCGFTDPDNRRTYPWGNEDKALIEIHRELIKIHNRFISIKKGSVKFLYNEYGTVCYSRFLENEKVIVILNNDKEKSIKIPVWEVGMKKVARVFLTENEEFDLTEKEYQIKDGFLEVELPKVSALILSEGE